MATPKVGSTRKTSNGCKVAKRVSREQARFREPSDNIAAIDFGTTNCSLAYVTVGHSEGGPVRLPLNTTFYRVPTAVLFTPDGTVVSFGYDGRQEYMNLDDDERLQYAYFEQIKMDLQHDEAVNRDMKIVASNNKQYYLVDVIAHILKYLKNELISQLRHGGHPLEATDFDWVITVPAIWKARGKQMMREAGYKAGLCSEESCGRLEVASTMLSFLRQPSAPIEPEPDKLSLALEPESAAIYCQNMSQEQIANYCDAVQPFTAASYLVVDVGGGTVDISALRVSSTSGGNIEAIHPPTGSDFGGTRVNREFETFLENTVNDPGFSKYVSTHDPTMDAKHRADLHILIQDTFEKQKRFFGSKARAGAKVAVQLPYTFLQVYRDDLENGLRQYSESEIKLQRQELRISSSIMEGFFQPIVDGMLQNLAQALQDVEVKIDTIYLVGGFGGCRYIFQAISEKFGDAYKYVTPAESDFAVVRGAVLFRQDPEVVHSRKIDATYGIDTNQTFNPLIHEPTYKWINDDNKEKCSNLFATVIERGDVVNTNEVSFATFYPVCHDQKEMKFNIYSSYEKDVWYVTGKRGKGERSTETVNVRKIGSFTIDMPILKGDKSRPVDVTFDFSHTEIQVKGYDQTSRNQVKTVLDFLSS